MTTFAKRCILDVWQGSEYVFCVGKYLFKIHYKNIRSKTYEFGTGIFIIYFVKEFPTGDAQEVILTIDEVLEEICLSRFRSSPPEVFLRKGVLKICKEPLCRGMISINLLCNFIEIALWHGCSPVNLLHISFS